MDIIFNTEEEYEEFKKWVDNPEKDNSPEMQRVRKVIALARKRRLENQLEDEDGKHGIR